MSMIEALLTEREGYVRRGLKARVAQVDDAIRALGVEVGPEVEAPEDAAPAVETATVKRGRR